jgi:stearoyl-CoA desaturase (delta-9 desaturase)
LNGSYVPEPKFDKNYPDWDKVDRIAESYGSRILFGAFYVIFYIVFATHWWMFLFLPIHFLMGPIQGAFVNWAGHKYGYRNYKEGDQSKNTLIFDFVLLGELFQNNHHHFAARSNFANKWFEFDPVYPVIKFLNSIHVIRLVRVT